MLLRLTWKRKMHIFPLAGSNSPTLPRPPPSNEYVKTTGLSHISLTLSLRTVGNGGGEGGQQGKGLALPIFQSMLKRRVHQQTNQRRSKERNKETTNKIFQECYSIRSMATWAPRIKKIIIKTNKTKTKQKKKNQKQNSAFL